MSTNEKWLLLDFHKCNNRFAALICDQTSIESGQCASEFVLIPATFIGAFCECVWNAGQFVLLGATLGDYLSSEEDLHHLLHITWGCFMRITMDIAGFAFNYFMETCVEPIEYSVGIISVSPVDSELSAKIAFGKTDRNSCLSYS